MLRIETSDSTQELVCKGEREYNKWGKSSWKNLLFHGCLSYVILLTSSVIHTPVHTQRDTHTNTLAFSCIILCYLKVYWMRSVLPFLLFSLTFSIILPIIHNGPVLNMDKNTHAQLPWGHLWTHAQYLWPRKTKLAIIVSLKLEEGKKSIEKYNSSISIRNKCAKCDVWHHWTFVLSCIIHTSKRNVHTHTIW